MKKTRRREVLARFGALGGGALLGLGARGTGAPGGLDGRPSGAASWKYVPLDPVRVAETAYRFFPEGGCMYAMVGSVVVALADAVGEPFRSFPFEMMRYGEGGLGRWGAVCGVVNGAAALFGLFHSAKEREPRETLIGEFCTWYETTELPHYQPSQPGLGGSVARSVAGSVLCHVSLSQWCAASKFTPFSPQKMERCRRLTADGAMKAVDLLNRVARGQALDGSIAAATRQCVGCHGSQGRADAVGKMACAPCHAALPADHGK